LQVRKFVVDAESSSTKQSKKSSA